jgi:hypothetical protein
MRSQPVSSNNLLLLPSSDPIQVDRSCDPEVLKSLTARFTQLVKQLDIARSRIGSLTVRIDELMAINDCKEAENQSLNRQLASEKRRRLH